MRIHGLLKHGIRVFFVSDVKIYGLFNFSEFDKTAWINERDGLYCDLLTGTLMEAAGVNIPAYGYMWLKKVR